MKKIYLGLTLLAMTSNVMAEQPWYGVVSLVKTTKHPYLYEGYDHTYSSGNTGYKLAAGYEFNKNIALELEWQKRRWKVEESLDSRTELSNNAFLLNAAYQLALQPQINIYAKVGLGASQNSLLEKADILGTYNYPKSTKTAFASSAGLGAKLEFTKNVGAGIEIRRINLGKANTKPAVEDGSYLSVEAKATEVVSSVYINF
jgi:opacity protein-like surface antigen